MTKDQTSLAIAIDALRDHIQQTDSKAETTYLNNAIGLIERVIGWAEMDREIEEKFHVIMGEHSNEK